MSNIVLSQASALAKQFNIAGNEQELVATLKATAFKSNATDAQMAALMLVAGQYQLNPFTKEIYAFPDRNNGIVPVVGVDGWRRIINSHPQFDGMDFEQDDEKCTCIIYRKDRSHPIKVTEWMSECKREIAGPWKTHPKRMLRHKAMIQGARLAFGFVGIYDQDEAERIAESEIQQARTPQAAAAQNAPDDLFDFEVDHLQAFQEAAANDVQALQDKFQSLPKTRQRAAFWQKHGPALKEAADRVAVIDAATGEVRP